MKACIALFAALACCANAAQADGAMHIDLGRGHFVIEADETVETLNIDTVDQPGACRQVLAAQTVDSSRIDVRPTLADCRSDQYAIVRINPHWQSALALQLAAGQIDFAPSFMRQIASVDATVNAGDIFGVNGVERRWLVGARVHVERQQPGMAVTVRVAAGQVSFAPDPGITATH
jgi:hypothetical protein